jgi:hypothetical protein
MTTKTAPATAGPSTAGATARPRAGGGKRRAASPARGKPTARAGKPSAPPGSVVAAVHNELRDLKITASRSVRAGIALAMARELDNSENTASGKASCGRVLDSVMSELRLDARRRRESQRPKTEPAKDGVVDLRERRAARRSGT